MDPIRFLIALAGSSLLTIACGFTILMVGVRGLRGKEFPITKTWSVSGLPARLAGAFMTFFGGFFLLAGIITIPLCLWRIWQLMNE